MSGFFITIFSVFIFERERETEHEKGRDREREIENLKQAQGSELSAQSPTQGLNSEPRDHNLSQSQTLNRLSHPGAPERETGSKAGSILSAQSPMQGLNSGTMRP